MNSSHKNFLLLAVFWIASFASSVGSFAAVMVDPPSAVGFTVQNATRISPNAIVFTLTNTGATSAAWSLSEGTDWMDVSPQSGTLLPGATAAVNVTANVLGTILPIGLHVGTITFGDGQVRTVPLAVDGSQTLFEDGFERKLLEARWLTTGTVSVAGQSYYFPSLTPRSGTNRLLLGMIGVRDDATLRLNLDGQSNVVLRFWAAAVDEKPHGPPASPFVGGADFDGVAVSTDGTNWYEVQPLRPLRDEWTEYVVDLDAALAAHGLVYGPNVRIRFNHFDSYGILALDDVRVEKVVPQSLRVVLPASMSEGGASATGTVFISPPQSVPVTVALSSNDASTASVPASVQIPAFASSTTFAISAPADGELDGSQEAKISANVLGFRHGSATLLVHDAQAATLSLSLNAASVGEGSSATATLLASAAPVRPVRVMLSSGDDVDMPQVVTIPAGATTVAFDVSGRSDWTAEGPENAVITAHVEHWVDATTTLSIDDTSTSPLYFQSHAPMIEGDGVVAGFYVHMRSRALYGSEVTLTSSHPALLTVPSTVKLSDSSASFSATVLDNAVMNGTQTVTITASCPGVSNATGSFVVIDNELHHLSISEIGATQVRNAPILTTITARNITDDIITDFSRTLTMSVSPNGATVPVSPATVTLSGGTWTGDIKVGADTPSAYLIATDVSGNLGVSNEFAVALGTLHHFGFSPSAASQVIDGAFPLTVSAVDAGGNVIPSYSGPVVLSGESKHVRPPVGSPAAVVAPHHESGLLDTSKRSARIETAYLPSEVGGVGSLGSIWLNFAVLPGSTYYNFVVRLKHRVPQQYPPYGSSGIFDNEGWTEVFRGDVNVTALGWREVVFPAPFLYDGANDLVVDLSFYNPSGPTGSGSYKSGRLEVTNVSSMRSLAGDDYSDYYDPIGEPYPYTFGDSTSQIPNVRFAANAPVSPIRPSLPVVLSGGVWSGMASVPFGSESVQIAAADGAGTSGKTSVFSVVPTPLPPGSGVIAKEDWESGSFASNWAVSGNNYVNTLSNAQISGADAPHGGTKQLLLDRSNNGNSGYRVLNEVTWTNDLSGQRGLTLKFWAKGFSEVADGPPNSPFTALGFFDGVAMSSDGVTWWEIQGLRTALSNSWTQYFIDLDTSIRSRGLEYGPGFKIRFNQYRNAYFFKGIAIDDIELVSSPVVGSVAVTLPAQIQEGATATGTVGIPFAIASDSTVNLNCSASAKVMIPSTVRIPAGQRNATFAIQVIDDPLPEGTKTVAVTAVATSFATSGKTMLVLDNDVPSFTFTAPASMAENGTTVHGIITLPSAAASTITFDILSSDASAISVPLKATILQGQSAVSVPLTPVNDSKIEGPQTVSVTASLGPLAPQVRTKSFADDETNVLKLVSASTPETTSVSEGSGSTITSFTASLSGTTTTATTLNFSSSSSRISAPASVTIAAGSKSATVVFPAVENAVADGSENVTLTVSATNFVAGTAAITVLDNDPHHFAISPIASPQVRGASIPVTITAKDIGDATVAGFSGPVTLSSAVAISPSSVVIPPGGVWSGNITVNDIASSVVVSASDAASHTGSSNAFDVGTSVFSRYTWDAISSPQTPGKSIPISFRASDEGGNLASASNTPVFVRAMTPTEFAIGGGTSSASAFIDPYYNRARSELLLLASEIGGAQTIAGFLWKVTSVDAPVTFNNFTVRIKTTNRTLFDENTTWDTDGWTVVHSSNLLVRGDGDVPVYFDTPLEYNGGSNLLVDVSFDNQTSNSYVFYWVGEYDYDCKVFEGTTNASGSPLLWTGTTGSAFATSFRPQTTVLSLAPVDIEIQGPSALTAGTWSGSAIAAGSRDRIYFKAIDASGKHELSNFVRISEPRVGAQLPFSDGFESGALSAAWSTRTTTSGRVSVQSANGPHAGFQHVVMDSSNSSSSREELDLTLDLEARNGVVLSFWAKVFYADDDGPPAAPFIEGADFDGVAMSADGSNWYEIQALRSMTVGAWTQFTVNLDTAIAARGLAYNSTFKIRFNNYGYYSAPTRGTAIDDVSVTAIESGVHLTLPASVLENSGAQTGTASIAAASATDTVIALVSSSPLLLSVPAQITIPAGQTSATFAITPSNDSVPNGSVSVSLTASIGGQYAGRGTLAFLSDESVALSLAFPAIVYEYGPSLLSGTVAVAFPVGSDRIVSLSLGGAAPLSLSSPSQVTILAGQTSAYFTVAISNNYSADPPRTVTLSALLLGSAPATQSTTVLDSASLPRLSLSYGSSVNEGATQTMTVSLSTELTEPLVVALASSDSTRLALPATVTIPAGSSSATFTLTGVENALFDGAKKVTVSASATGLQSATSDLIVSDNDPHHFTMDVGNGSKIKGAAFSTAISAVSIDGNIITSFAGPVTLSGTGDAGALSITPASITISSGGTVSQNVKVNTFSNNVRLTATNGTLTGTSTPFTVGTGSLHHYTWSSIPTSQIAGQPFVATISAFDSGNNPVSAASGYLQIAGPPEERVIGSGTGTSNVMPLSTSFHDERTQVLYLASEVGNAGLLSSISLYVNAPPGQTLNAWTIRLQHAASLDSWLNTGWTTVYSANETITQTGWKKFIFTTPFAYNGTSSLIVDFSFNNSSLSTAGAVLTFNGSPSFRAIYARVNSTNGDPKTWASFTPSPTSSTALPQVIFNQDALPTNPPTPGAIFLQNGTWTGPISFPQAGSGKLVATDFQAYSATSNTFTLAAAADTDSDKLPDWWETTNGLSASGASGTNGPDGDPDGDKISNILEFALGLNPQVSSSEKMPTAQVQSNPADGQNYLTYTYPRRIGASALTYTVQTSPDFSVWSSGAAVTEQIGAIPSADGATERVVVRILPALSPANPARFVRLRVTSP